VLGEVEGLEEFVGSPTGVLPAHPVGATLADQLVAATLLMARGVALADVPDAAAYVATVGDHVVPGDLGRAGRRRDQGGKHPQGGRLAGAIGAEERDELARGDLQVEAAHGLDRLLVAGEVLGQPAGPDHRAVGSWGLGGVFAHEVDARYY